MSNDLSDAGVLSQDYADQCRDLGEAFLAWAEEEAARVRQDAQTLEDELEEIFGSPNSYARQRYEEQESLKRQVRSATLLEAREVISKALVDRGIDHSVVIGQHGLVVLFKEES